MAANKCVHLLGKRCNQRMQRTIFAHLRGVQSGGADGEQQVFIVTIASAKFSKPKPQRVNGCEFGGKFGQTARSVQIHASVDKRVVAYEARERLPRAI